ncbi:MAG: hypothetical protein H0W58_16380 [Acidobacteria bacterium]|jgi:hypothetical protein|nr:hypothetical protein [Acidobacteriota bacterium]
MANTRNFKTQTAYKLPLVARRLIEENKQMRICGTDGVNFLGQLEKTTAYLRWKTACNTLSDAIGYIESELERERFYALYRTLFPKEWIKSRASFKLTGYNEFHTERELEFIELVSDRYFPLCMWLDWSDFRFDHIPIEPVNYDFCCDEFELEDFRPCLQFAVTAFLWRDTDVADENWCDVLAGFNVEFEDLPPINRKMPPYSILDAGRDEPKVQRFLHLIEFIFHDTGNTFIDTTYCQPVEFYDWRVETLEKLKAEYEAVSKYFESMESIDASIEQNALRTFRELIALWNTGRLPVNGRRKKVADKEEKDRGLLINILTETEERGETALTF